MKYFSHLLVSHHQSVESALKAQTDLKKKKIIIMKDTVKVRRACPQTYGRISIAFVHLMRQRILQFSGVLNMGNIFDTINQFAKWATRTTIPLILGKPAGTLASPRFLAIKF